jgi:hypothetical protein
MLINTDLHLRWPVIGAEFIKVAQESLRSVLILAIKFYVTALLTPKSCRNSALTHVLRLTDDTGIVQHAKYGIPELKRRILP